MTTICRTSNLPLQTIVLTPSTTNLLSFKLEGFTANPSAEIFCFISGYQPSSFYFEKQTILNAISIAGKGTINSNLTTINLEIALFDSTNSIEPCKATFQKQ